MQSSVLPPPFKLNFSYFNMAGLTFFERGEITDLSWPQFFLEKKSGLGTNNTNNLQYLQTELFAVLLNMNFCPSEDFSLSYFWWSSLVVIRWFALCSSSPFLNQRKCSASVASPLKLFWSFHLTPLPFEINIYLPLNTMQLCTFA